MADQQEKKPITIEEARQGLDEYIQHLRGRLDECILATINRLTLHRERGFQDAAMVIKRAFEGIIPLEYRLHELMHIVAFLCNCATMEEMSKGLDMVDGMHRRKFIDRYHHTLNTGIQGLIEDYQREVEAIIIRADMPAFRAIIGMETSESDNARTQMQAILLSVDAWLNDIRTWEITLDKCTNSMDLAETLLKEIWKRCGLPRTMSLHNAGM